MNTLEWLKGKKTYIIVIVGILIVVSESVLGIDIPGAEVDNPINYLLVLLGLGGVRAGVAKANGG